MNLQSSFQIQFMSPILSNNTPLTVISFPQTQKDTETNRFSKIQKTSEPLPHTTFAFVARPTFHFSCQ